MIGKIDDASFRVTAHEALFRFDHPSQPVVAQLTEAKRNPVAPEAETMPAGVMRWPPPRPGNYELRRVSPARVIQAMHALETKPALIVHAAHAAPADPLFAVWFRVLDWLGTRTLTMGEMSSLICAHAAGQSATGEARIAKTLLKIDKVDAGLKSFGELCKFAGALAGDALAAQGPLLFGVLQAGHAGAFVKAVDQTPDETDQIVVAEVVVLKEFVVADLLPPPVLSPGEIFWSRVTPRLSQAPVDLIVGLIDSFSESDDSLEEKKRANAFTPAPEPASASAPRQRARPAAVSVSRMTADIQLAQVMNRHFKLDQPGERVDVRDPDATLDLVDAYRLYRQLIDTRELTSRQTVEAWLVDWGVERAP